jgi:hypothetical protein
MSFTDVLLLTLVNFVACLVMPRLLFLFTAKVKTKKESYVHYSIEAPELTNKVPNFP